MASIFTRIVAGEIPCYKIAEDDRFISFLDIRPLHEGHALAVPKAEVDNIFDLDDGLLTDLMLFAKRVANAQRAVISCQRVGVLVIGEEVPHAHIHLIPFDKASQMSFVASKPLSFSPDEMREIAARIAAAM